MMDVTIDGKPSSLAFNVCSLTARKATDGQRDFANVKVGAAEGSAAPEFKHLTSDSIDEVKVEILGKENI